MTPLSDNTNTSGRFRVYSASAGSGKTFRLTIEYLTFALRDPLHNYKKILAITFTNKATREMKNRIIETCRAFSQPLHPSVENKNYYPIWSEILKSTGLSESKLAENSRLLYHQILHNYSDFAVSTIDSFSQRIIRSFARELNVQDNFEVELQQSLVLDEVVNRLLNEVGVDNEITKLLTSINRYNLTDFDNFNIRDTLLRSAAIMFQDSSKKFIAGLDKISSNDLLEVGERISKKRGQLRQQLRDKASESLRLIQQAGLSISDFAYGSSSFVNTYNKILSGDFDLKPRFINSITDDNTPWFSKGKEKDISSIKPQLITHSTEIIDLAGEFNIYNFIHKNFRQLAAITQLRKMYNNFKNEENIILISEFNQLISNEIADQPAPFIYEKIGAQFDYYLIDEFQDTSVMQFQNIVPLMTESLSRGGGESLVVGDSKQAIYRFRGGDTTQLVNLPALMGSDANPILREHQLILEQNQKKESLPKNFRSRAQIVEFNNDFYEFINESTALIAHHPVYENQKQEIHHRGTGGYVSIELFDKDSSKAEPYENEIAEELEVLSANVLSRTIEVINQALTRGYFLKDIAIICRNNKGLQLIAQALHANHIAVISQEGMLLTNDISISLFPLLYGHFTAPDDQIILLEIFTKLKFLGLLNVDLHTLNKQTLHAATLWEKLKVQGFDLEEILSKNLLEAWDLFESKLPKDKMSPLFHGYFREEIFNFLQKWGDDFNLFYNWWNTNRDKLFIGSPESVDGVQLLTIHKAKGLEFKIVILPLTNWKILKEESFWIELEMEDFTPLDAVYAGISETEGQIPGLDLAYNEKLQKITLDNLNLLYVATTRAISELYIFSDSIVEKKGKKEEPDLGKMSYITNYIHAYLENKSIHQFPYTLGALTQPDYDDRPTSISIPIDTEKTTGAPITIKHRSTTIWDDTKLDKINYGTTMHALLEHIISPEQVEQVINQAVITGLLSTEDKISISVLINKLVTHPEISPYFDSAQRVKIEASIITPEGKEYIPDRILIHDDRRLSLLDFKTGEHKSKHTQQIQHYASLLRQMDYKVIGLSLVYLDPLEIIHVEPTKI